MAKACGGDDSSSWSVESMAVSGRKLKKGKDSS